MTRKALRARGTVIPGQADTGLVHCRIDQHSAVGGVAAQAVVVAEAEARQAGVVAAQAQ